MLKKIKGLKRAAALCMVICLILSLSACGGSQKAKEDSASATQDTRETAQDQQAQEEVSEVSKPAVQRVVNIADEAKKEDNTANEISGNVMWGIIFILLIFCIIFLPRTRGMEFVKDRYRYRKAKNITRRHIR